LPASSATSLSDEDETPVSDGESENVVSSYTVQNLGEGNQLDTTIHHSRGQSRLVIGTPEPLKKAFISLATVNICSRIFGSKVLPEDGALSRVTP